MDSSDSPAQASPEQLAPLGVEAEGTPRGADPALRDTVAVSPTTGTDAAAEQPGWTAHAGLVYGLMRIGLLIAVGGLLYGVGLRGWLWVLVTTLASALASWFLLVNQREAAARKLAAAAASRHDRTHPADITSPDRGSDPEVGATTP